MNPLARLAAVSVLFTLGFAGPPAAAQTLDLVPSQLNFRTEVGAPSPEPQTFEIVTSPEGQRFSVSKPGGIISTPWLSLLPTNGTTPETITVLVDGSGFTQPGMLQGDLRVTLPDSGQSAILRVQVTIDPPSDPPVVSAAPESVAFSVSSAGVVPTPQSLTITNPGGGIASYALGVTYPAGAPQGWLSVTPPTGSVSFDSRTHNVSVTSTADLPEGTHEATILAQGEFSNSPFPIPVTLTVGASPNISASPTSLTFFASAGGAFPEIQTVAIRNEGGGTLTYDIEGDQPWLAIRPARGDATNAPVIHEVLPDIRDLAQGTYTGNLVVTSETLGEPFLIPVTLTIGPPSQLFTLPSSLDFVGPKGLPFRQKRQISIVNTPLTRGRWQARVEPPHAASWLKITPADGRIPGHLTVEVDQTGLGGPVLEAAIRISPAGGSQTAAAGEEAAAPQQASAERVIPVRLTLQTAAPLLGVAPAALRFQGTAGAAEILTQALEVRNLGGPQASWLGETETENGVPWLSLAPSSGLAPTLAQASVSTAGLPAGVHHGRVILTTGPQRVVVPVVLVLAEDGAVIDTSATGVYWETTGEGAALPSELVRIFNRGRGRQTFAVRRTGVTGGSVWFQGDRATGAAVGLDNGAESRVRLEADAGGLTPGLYGGLIEIAPDSGATPRLVSAMLRVARPTDAVFRSVQPGGLAFVADGGAPSAQTFRVWRNRAGVVGFQAAATTLSGGDWLTATPPTGETGAGGAADVSVTVDPDGLAAGVYRGRVGVTFGDGFVDGVDVTLVVPRVEPFACNAPALTVASLAPNPGFQARAGRAVRIAARAFDSCGEPVANASVLAQFSTGDPALPLKPLGGGRYGATWTPANSAPQANVRLRAKRDDVEAETTVVGDVEAGSIPTLATHGIVNGASFRPGEAISPGEILSVFGRDLTFANAAAESIPLPVELGGVELRIGAQEAPLYFASLGQVNAQALFDLTPGTTVQAVLRNGPQYTTPVEVAVGTARPGVFVTPSAEGLNRAIVQNQDGSLNSPMNPARRGEAFVVYLTGVGAVDPPVTAGEGSPGVEPLARATAFVSATVGGEDAEVFFLGLTPGFVGLAQANVLVPAAAPVGSDEVLTLTIDGNPANDTLVAIAPAP